MCDFRTSKHQPGIGISTRTVIKFCSKLVENMPTKAHAVCMLTGDTHSMDNYTDGLH